MRMGARGGRSLGFLERVHDVFDGTTGYFRGLEERGKGFRYRHLVAAHVMHAVRYWNDAWANIRGDEGRGTHEWYGLRDWIAEGAHMYWEYLPKVVQEVRRRGCELGEEVLREAWVVMMLRGFCWWRCHYMMPGQDMVKDEKRVDSKYWHDEMPVFMG